MTEIIARENSAGDNDASEAGVRTKERLLLLLKTRGAMTTKALAGALGISVPATRTHLKSLGAEVTAVSEPGGVGRPAQTWRLTDAAQDRFPNTHSELTVSILQSVERALGQAGLDAVIADRYAETEAQYASSLAGATSIAGKLKRLVRLRSEEGYMAALEKTAEGWLLLENHCPICAAATACQGFCANELTLFRKLLGPDARVDRVEYLLEGGRRCAYLVTS